MANVQDLIGKTFGQLTILEGIPREKNTAQRVIAKCECGVIKSYLLVSLRKARPTVSCGCFRVKISKSRFTTHGLRKHPLYRIWADIKTRCTNPNVKHFENYGGRGVRLCDEWIDNPEEFIKWALQNGWVKGLQIDKDKKGGNLIYSPSSCSVVTQLENGRYTRTNRKIEYKGELKCLAEWSEYAKVSKATFWYRIKKCNWDMYIYVIKWGELQ